jgi:hypothetical protein
MNVGFKGRQDTGKTLTMVATLQELCLRHGYSPSEAVGNVGVNLDGFVKLNNDGLREYVKRTCSEGLRHKIILIDEIDSVFPARFWSDKAQTETLLGLWQDVKLFNWVLYTAHLGKAIDKIIRDCTQIVVIPEYVREDDAIYLEIIDGLDLMVFGDVIYPASAVFPLYDRWEVVQ